MCQAVALGGEPFYFSVKINYGELMYVEATTHLGLAGNSLLTPAGGVVVLRCFRRVQSSIATFPPTHELAFLCW